MWRTPEVKQSLLRGAGEKTIGVDTYVFYLHIPSCEGVCHKECFNESINKEYVKSFNFRLKARR